MFPDDDPRTSGLRMIRDTHQVATSSLRGGRSPAYVRETIIPPGLRAIDGCAGFLSAATRAFLRSKLIDAVERAIFELHQQPAGA